MQKNLVYIISSCFDYKKLILRDHGPGYAEDMGWQFDKIHNLELYADRVFIIDNRITDHECMQIKEFVLCSPKKRFIFTIIDPYYEWEKDKTYIKTLFELKKLDNVFFLSKYSPAEITKDLDNASGHKKLLVLPYPFRKVDLRPIKFSLRQHKLFVSGNMHSGVYPLRYAVKNQAKWNPLLWGNVAFLQHPGYSDIGQQTKHDIIGNSYIDYLSKYTLMLCCPSRCDLEFLKFSECAYAGCVPVGRAPATFSQELKECVLEINPKRISSSVRSFLKIPLVELQQRAERFRYLMQRDRDPDLLNQKLHSFLQNL